MRNWINTQRNNFASAGREIAQWGRAAREIPQLLAMVAGLIVGITIILFAVGGFIYLALASGGFVGLLVSICCVLWLIGG